MIRTTASSASIFVLACTTSVAFASEASRVTPQVQTASSGDSSGTREQYLNEVSSVRNHGPNGLKPRVITAKKDPVSRLHRGFADGSLKPNVEEMNLPLTIVVKFRDELLVRASDGGLADVNPSQGALASTSGGNIEEANAILSQLGGRVRQWINRTPAELAHLEQRAINASGAMQPDLAGMIEVRVNNASQLFGTARALNALECVEYASINRHYANFQCGENPQPCSSPSCMAPSQCNPAFGTEFTNYGCSNLACCTAVAALDPVCGEDVLNGWDRLCAGLANAICGSAEGATSIFAVPPGQFDPCFGSAGDESVIDPVYEQYHFTIQFNSCFLAHDNLGCSLPACCFGVCTFDPTCCADGWDETCVVLAASGMFPACESPIPTIEPSPDFTVHEVPFPATPGDPNGGLQGLQFYTQGEARAATVDPVYVSPGVTVRWPGILDRTGFYGEQLGLSGNGYALQQFEDFQNFVWNTYQGGAGEENPNLRGAGIRIAVLETAAYTNHEEFVLSGPAKNPARPWDGPLLETARVIAEVGQTPLLIEDGNISANHGTNTLGVIFSADNGFGITGMATGAQGYFYPIISMEEGYRAQNALTACLLEFEMGDVINYSWGFTLGLPYTAGNFQPVTSDPALSQLMALGTVLGVTSVAAAGGDPLIGAPINAGGIEDQGAIIVGGIRAGNLVRDTIPGEIGGEVEPGEYNPPNNGACAANLFDVLLNPMKERSSNFTSDPTIENATVDSCGWGEFVVTTGATTSQLGSMVSNPTRAIFTGINEVPPTGYTPELQVDKLRAYSTEFGGTSAACAMMASVVANFQGAARQYFGTPLSPLQVRDMLRGGPFNWQQCGGGGPIGVFPNLMQLGPTMIGTPLVDGNETEIIVHAGLPLPGYAWNSFLIKALDLNFLRIAVERKQAGTINEGLTYMATGPTTDVQAKLNVSSVVDAAAEVTNLGITTVSRATKNFVMMGVFVKNLNTHRYEFFGFEFLTTADGTYQFDLPNLTNYSAYIDPNTHVLDMRVWTCGLGTVGRHQVWHDLIEVRVNQPMNPL